MNLWLILCFAFFIVVGLAVYAVISHAIHLRTALEQKQQLLAQLKNEIETKFPGALAQENSDSQSGHGAITAEIGNRVGEQLVDIPYLGHAALFGLMALTEGVRYVLTPKEKRLLQRQIADMTQEVDTLRFSISWRYLIAYVLPILLLAMAYWTYPST